MLTLIDYVKSGNIDKIKLCCEMVTKGDLTKEIMKKDNSGSTALYWASWYGHLEIVKLLITEGNLQKEDIMMENYYGNTALFWASCNGHFEIVKLLIKKGNLQKEDILPILSQNIGEMENNYGDATYTIADNESTKQLFKNVFFNEDINDMIIDIQLTIALYSFYTTLPLNIEKIII